MRFLTPRRILVAVIVAATVFAVGQYSMLHLDDAREPVWGTRACILYVVRNHNLDIKELSASLFTLQKYKTSLRKYPVVILAEGLNGCTENRLRRVAPDLDIRFEAVSLDDLEDAIIDMDKLTYTDEDRLRNHRPFDKVVRLLLGDIFHFNELHRFTHALRLDTDSVFANTENHPSLVGVSVRDPLAHAMQHELIYASWGETLVCGDRVSNLHSTLRDYVAANSASNTWANPREQQLAMDLDTNAKAVVTKADTPLLAAQLHQLLEKPRDSQRDTCTDTACHCQAGYDTSLEVFDLRVFRSDSYQHLVDHIERAGGIAHHGWGPDVLRRAILSLLAPPDTVQIINVKDYAHKKEQWVKIHEPGYRPVQICPDE